MYKDGLNDYLEANFLQNTKDWLNFEEFDWQFICHIFSKDFATKFWTNTQRTCKSSRVKYRAENPDFCWKHEIFALIFAKKHTNFSWTFSSQIFHCSVIILPTHRRNWNFSEGYLLLFFTQNFDKWIWVLGLHSAHLPITAYVTEWRQNTLKCSWSDADYCANFSFLISDLLGYKFCIQSPRVKMAL